MAAPPDEPVKDAPKLDKCSDAFIDKAEDEIQAAIDDHKANAKKGTKVGCCSVASCPLLDGGLVVATVSIVGVRR
jgi:hypothetical protein